MTTDSMARTYVLVHGAWFGGWAWRDVAPALRAAGHCVTTPTLTGLGERAHLATPATGLDTHVADVVAARGANEPVPIRDPATFGVDDAAVLTYCAPRLRPQPVRCMTEPVHLPGGLPDHVSRSYVLCTKPESTSFRAAYETCRADPRWHTAELATTHVCMLTDPAGTTQALLDAP